MASGVVVTATKSLFRNLAHQADLIETLGAISRSLKSMNLSRIGMALCLIKIKDRVMHVTSAWIPPVLLHRAASGTVEEVLIGGMPLGYSALATY